ncbi:hypothetical protein ACFYQT_39875 [Streptomyces tibetensis]|uniref:Uncharacterized protein n=1 Tax=Streptomyces tibetensis TaxID=2382123 RepID=A0ABW6N8T7_9ACTN
MSDYDHVQHTWHLTHDNGDEITIDLWTDDYSVRVDGGPDDGHEDERGRDVIEQQLLPKYIAAGYRLTRDYPVNDRESHEEPAEDDQQPEGADQKPDQCPQCASTDFEYAPNYTRGWREGPAWRCADPSCSWGQWIVV